MWKACALDAQFFFFPKHFFKKSPGKDEMAC